MEHSMNLSQDSQHQPYSQNFLAPNISSPVHVIQGASSSQQANEIVSPLSQPIIEFNRSRRHHRSTPVSRREQRPLQPRNATPQIHHWPQGVGGAPCFPTSGPQQFINGISTPSWNSQGDIQSYSGLLSTTVRGGTSTGAGWQSVELHKSSALRASNGDFGCYDPAYGTQTPTQGVDLVIRQYDPTARAAPTRGSEERKGRTEEDDSRRRTLKDKGGACIWCAKRKQTCRSLQKVCAFCQKRGLPCLRNSEQIWLYTTISIRTGESRSTAISHAQERTFIEANGLVETLRASLVCPQYMAQNPKAKVVLQIRSKRPGPSNIIVLDLKPDDRPPNHYRLLKKEKNLLVDAVISNVELPGYSHLNTEFQHSKLFSLAMTIFQSTTFVNMVTEAVLFARPADYGPTRVALADLLLSLAKVITQTADMFCSELLPNLKPSTKELAPEEIRVALSLYYRSLVALSNFQADSIVYETFSGILTQLPISRALIEGLLGTAWFSIQDTEMKFPGSPQVQVAAYLHSGNEQPTALQRRSFPFGLDPIISVSRLLTSHYNGDLPFNLNDQGVLSRSPAMDSPHPIDAVRGSVDVSGLGGWTSRALPIEATPCHDDGNRDDSLSDLNVEQASRRSSQHQTLKATESSSSTHADDDFDRRSAEPDNIVDQFFDFSLYYSHQGGVFSNKKRDRSVGSDTLEKDPRRPRTEAFQFADPLWR
ncbi:hypothetical protein AJ79_06282 [Helicocarpus griseus UAMH5409]|uniref:Zn(2)-C6 fungal-type domain-containing protein n=1 Tax=Helicocarpus griseus UAMH5409 TaxID=1447875 RepID=A0A2B7XEQ8_9EURO|nr:hypothetical protein AJ79_06282 [Helicocarpus griseus UAMH5409]